MEIYNFSNFDLVLHKSNSNSYDIDNNKKLFMQKLLTFFKVYDLYDFYRNNFHNHPSFSIDGTDIGTKSLFTSNNIPNTKSITFKSVNEEDFKYILINNIMLTNAIVDISNNVNIDERTKVYHVNRLETEINDLLSNINTDDNDILSNNVRFISVFKINNNTSSFFTFISDDDYKLLIFVRNMINYFLISTKTDYNIHYGIIKKEIEKNFAVLIEEETNLNELIYTIEDGINMISYIYDELIKKKYEKKYLGICVILYTIKFNIGLYYSFVNTYSLYSNLYESKIF